LFSICVKDFLVHEPVNVEFLGNLISSGKCVMCRPQASVNVLSYVFKEFSGVSFNNSFSVGKCEGDFACSRVVMDEDRVLKITAFFGQGVSSVVERVATVGFNFGNCYC
jgi:hypothetical protein